MINTYYGGPAQHLQQTSLEEQNAFLVHLREAFPERDDLFYQRAPRKWKAMSGRSDQILGKRAMSLKLLFESAPKDCPSKHIAPCLLSESTVVPCTQVIEMVGHGVQAVGSAS